MNFLESQSMQLKLFQIEGKSKSELENYVKALKRHNYILQSNVQQVNATIYGVEQEIGGLKNVAKVSKDLVRPP